MVKNLSYFTIINSIFLSVLFYLYRVGYINIAWENDISYIVPSILIVFVIGLFFTFKNYNIADWCNSALLTLGLMGTILGLYTIFGSIKPDEVGDVNAVSKVIGILITGTGQAFWTTLTGAFFSLWLSVNMVVFKPKGLLDETS